MHDLRTLTPSLFRILRLGSPLTMLWAAMVLSGLSAPAADKPSALVFGCRPDNDLYQVLSAALGEKPPRFDTPATAVAQAGEGTGVLLLADEYPAKTTTLEAALFEAAARKRLRLFVEYPSFLPEMKLGAPQTTRWERVVVASESFSPSLGKLRILALNDCHYVPMKAAAADLVLARVAGFDTAVFGLPTNGVWPILFEHPQGNLMVASTKLSHFVAARYTPAQDWAAVWRRILTWVAPGAAIPPLKWTPTVRPTFGRTDPLPPDVESQALRRSADWITRSRILRHPAWPDQALRWSMTYNTVRPAPAADWAVGDGSLGLLEGYSSTIRADGTQPMRYAVRDDNMTEVAMLLAFDATTHRRPQSARICTNLLAYDFTQSGLASGPRADPARAAYGLLGWALDSPDAYWGDDNARAILSLAAASALLKDSIWDAATTRCLLSNFRTTGRSGFREACIQGKTLESKGWRSYWDGDLVSCSPHYQSWLWACYLWAYDQTRFEPLLQRSKKGLGLMMDAYPRRWDWCLRSGGIERARLLLPLAWLVRVEDTAEHRAWLRRIATDLVSFQDASGAIGESIGNGGAGADSNADYGTRESSLIQNNGDPVADLLYTCNFALIGLHEAAAATGEPFYTEAEDRLARFLCRIQISSQAHPELDGAWYRAFDYRRWEYWASSADWEWGPWCTESGWTQPWIAGTLALRLQKTSLWELIKTANIRDHFARARPQMLPDPALVPSGRAP